MTHKKAAVESGVGAVDSGETAILRRRVAELEAEVRALRKAGTAVDGALPAREALLNEAEKIAHLGTWFLNPHTQEVKWSEELFRILGYDPATDTASAEKFFQALHPEDLPRSLKNMETLQDTGRMLPLDLRVVWKDGTVREIRTDGSVIRDEDGKMFRVVGTVLDVTEPRSDRREAIRIARFLQEAQSVAKVGSWIWGSESGILDWSSALREIFGLPQDGVISLDTFKTHVHPDDRAVMAMNREHLQRTGKCGPVEIRIIRPDGSLRYTLMQAKRIEDDLAGGHRMLGTMWDITDRKHLEEQLRQSQKMEVVGRVAGGVAHDFNNLLTVISGNADLMLEDMVDDRLERIHDAAEVGAALTRQLLAFSRQAVVKPSPMDLNGAVRDMARIVERLIGEDIAIKFELAPAPAVINADRGQVQQILLNLAVNARDAMGKGGELTFSRQAVVKPSPMDLNGAVRDMARIVERLIGEDISIKFELAPAPAVINADRGQVQQILLNLAVNARDAMGKGGELTFSSREAPGNPLNAGMEPARWVELKVRDTGKGMDALTQQRAFEPFFTTKEPGKGTGLGLSTIADIVAQMKGTIAIASEPNRGTTVTIRFPHSSLKIESPPEAKTQARNGGSESILLVEDNAELRELVSVFLVSGGYRVQAVGRPVEAERLWATQKDSVDLLITDMVMPEKNGKELAKVLLAAKPGLKTLFISGYSPNRSGLGESGFLQKPFTRSELLDAVRALCDREAPSGSPGVLPGP